LAGVRVSRRLKFTAWTKSYVRKGDIGARLGANLTLAHNTLGSCDFTISAKNPRVADLTASGARVTVDYFPDDGITPIRYSGEVTNIHGEGRAEQATRTFTVGDDWNVLNTTVGYPNPTGTDSQQGASGAYYVSTGPAETVALNVISVNSTRAGLGLTVPSSSGRGSTITVQLRMHPLADRLFPAVDQAGVGVRVVQQDTGGRAVQVYAPTTYARILTEASGIVQNVSFDLARETVTRVIVGVSGQGTARTFRTIIGTAAETAIGAKLEAFVDARDIDAAATDLTAQVAARAQEALTEGAAKASLGLTLVERGAFRFGTTFHLGDRVTMQTLNGPQITDLIRSVQITEDSNGIRVTPTVGERSDVSDFSLERIVAKLAKSLRDLKRS
jgi:hypothetical protein